MITEHHWERVARAESEIIVDLSELARDLMTKLAQYTGIEAEEARLREILDEQGDSAHE